MGAGMKAFGGSNVRTRTLQALSVLSLSVTTPAFAQEVVPPVPASQNSPAAQQQTSSVTAPAPAGNASQESIFWASAEHSNTAADYKAYLDAFPNGLYAQMAKNRIAALSVSPPAAVPVQAAGPNQQETSLWDSAQHSNLAEDYQAYLSAYPNGVYAQMAKNRIAALGEGPVAPPSAHSAMVSAFGPPPQAVAPDALKAEVGTMETEDSLGMGPPQRIELQQRLQALDLYTGPIDGNLGPGARGAIAEWQKRHGLAPTGDLGPLQLAALRLESEDAFQHMVVVPIVPAPVIVHRRVVVVHTVEPVPLIGGLIDAIKSKHKGHGEKGKGGFPFPF